MMNPNQSIQSLPTNEAGQMIELIEMPELDQVYSAIKSMYEQNKFHDIASKWLEALQRSVFAWKVSDQLLIQKLDFPSCYFAAQTLKTKIQKSFKELPAESYDSLKDSLINHLNNMNERVIQTQLCLCLTHIFFLNPNWTTPIEELSKKLTDKVKFIELLICFAQEFQSNRAPYKHREQIRNYFSDNFFNISQLIIQLLNECPKFEQNIQEQIIQQCFSCFEAWIQFAKKDQLEFINPILIKIFQSLNTPDCSTKIHEDASNALCKLIDQCESQSDFADIRNDVHQQVFNLENAFQMAVAVEDSAKLMDLTKIFVELGNTTIDFIVNEQVNTKIIELILNCVSHYEFDVAEITFSFWYNFSEAIRQYDHNKFKSYYNLLLTALTRHSMLERDMDGIIDEKTDSYDYRSQISELIEEIAFCFDWIDYVESIKLIENLKPQNSWEIIEAHVYILYCIATDRDSFEQNLRNDQVLPDLMNVLLGLLNSNNQLHPQLFVTCCDFLGEINSWINENLNFLQSTVEFLIMIINSQSQNLTELAIKAGTALKQILYNMRKVDDIQWINKLFVELINIYAKIGDRVELGVPLLACGTCLISNKLIEKCDQQENFFIQLIQLCLNTINNFLQSKSTSEEHSKKWVKIIDNIYSIFKDFKPNHATRNSPLIHTYIRDNIWPFLRGSINHFSPVDSQIVEHCCRCLRHIVRSMKPIYLLQPIIDHIVPLFQQYPDNTSLIYIGSVLVDEFANDQDEIMAEGLIRMLNAFSSVTLCYLNDSNLHENSYMVDDYFNLCTRVLNKLTPRFMANTETLNGILNLVVKSLIVPDKEVHESVNKFVQEFLSTQNPIEIDLINSIFGRTLFATMIDSIVFNLPAYFIPDTVTSLWKFKINHPERFTEYLQFTTNILNSSIELKGYAVKEDDLKTFYERINSAMNPKAMASELRYIQRLVS
ncbi:Transportin-3 [Sarcoptes scabiei]|nr:Transportin-3 [Sarcoptes scabiei]